MSAGEPLRLEGITKRFGARAVLEAVDLELAPDRYTCIMGPSGSGKTTLLRIAAGFEQADAGGVLLGSRDLSDLPPERRPLHTVFQDLALFPYLTVRQNVAFAGMVARRSAAELKERADTLLREVGLDPDTHGERHPDALSGGERQRVALVRSLFETPAFLLLDEPLTALDRDRRSELRRVLVEVQRARGIGFVHVTHDPEEALAAADVLVVLDGGRVVARGAPDELYRSPPDPATARLLGELTALPGGGFARPERIRVRADAGGRAPVQEVARAFLGERWELTLRAGDDRVVVHVGEPAPGEVRSLDWNDADVLTFSSR